jgi:hypothetical protein
MEGTMFDLNAAHRRAYDEVWDALPSNDPVPALFAAGYTVGAQEDLAQWLMEEEVCTPAQLVRAVQAGTLAAWYHEFSNVWATRRAWQLKRLHALGEDMSDATEGWQ